MAQGGPGDAGEAQEHNKEEPEEARYSKKEPEGIIMDCFPGLAPLAGRFLRLRPSAEGDSRGLREAGGAKLKHTQRRF